MGPTWRLISPATRRRLGGSALASLVLPWLGGEIAKSLQQPGLVDDPARAHLFIDIMVAAVTVFALTTVFTVAMGCLVTAVMKGPRRLGDPFPSDRP